MYGKKNNNNKWELYEYLHRTAYIRLIQASFNIPDILFQSSVSSCSSNVYMKEGIETVICVEPFWIRILYKPNTFHEWASVSCSIWSMQVLKLLLSHDILIFISSNILKLKHSKKDLDLNKNLFYQNHTICFIQSEFRIKCDFSNDVRNYIQFTKRNGVLQIDCVVAFNSSNSFNWWSNRWIKQRTRFYSTWANRPVSSPMSH